ncbi:unnamed protein product [Brachionus calyciflorus]|uniref:Uncharacterized protein n=1 Tax=Brachionus calyciflorus TaxID=104777 RepID=A0A814C5V6_9BILA|nr:unnamed protein product [Brachionus calyciflorus]
MVKISRHNHISSIRKVLKILNVDQPYIHSKLSFQRNIRFNNTCFKLMEYLQNDLNNRPRSSKSIVKDFVLCEKYFNTDFESIYKNIITYINKLKNELTINDGLKDSINKCIDLISNNYYHQLLKLPT